MRVKAFLNFLSILYWAHTFLFYLKTFLFNLLQHSYRSIPSFSLYSIICGIHICIFLFLQYWCKFHLLQHSCLFIPSLAAFIPFYSISCSNHTFRFSLLQCAYFYKKFYFLQQFHPFALQPSYFSIKFVTTFLLFYHKSYSILIFYFLIVTLLLTFLIHPFQQKTNSCLLMLPSPETLKIMNRSEICWESILSIAIGSLSKCLGGTGSSHTFKMFEEWVDLYGPF